MIASTDFEVVDLTKLMGVAERVSSFCCRTAPPAHTLDSSVGLSFLSRALSYPSSGAAFIASSLQPHRYIFYSTSSAAPGSGVFAFGGGGIPPFGGGGGGIAFVVDGT